VFFLLFSSFFSVSDFQLTNYRATGIVNQADINPDIDLMIGLQASKAALTASFPKIIIAGNVADKTIPTEELLGGTYEVKNGYSMLTYEHYSTSLPF
jgi:hypothetical protein